MNIKLIPVGYLETNCCVVDDKNAVCVVIDPGDDAEKILSYLKSAKLKCEYILLTHGHFDHIGALADVKNATGAKIAINAADKANLPIDADVFVNDGDELCAGELKFKVLTSPGHTEGSVCYLCGDTLFAGDTLFLESAGRTDLAGGSYVKLRESLKKLKDLPQRDLAVIPGHGPVTTLAHERTNNPFMKAL